MRTLSEIADERDEIHPFEFAQVVAGHLGFGETADEAPAAEEPAEDLETDEVTIDSTGRAHGPDGKFVPKADSEEESDDEDEDEDEYGELEGTLADGLDEEDEVDPEIASILAKYGDEKTALKALAESQSYIGKQGQQLGELRQMVEKLNARLEEAAAAPPQPQVSPLQAMKFMDLLDENPKAAVNLAVQAGDIEMVEEAVKAWAQDEPFEAAQFWSNLQTQFAMEVARAQAAPQPQAAAPAATNEQAELDAEMAALLERAPDLEQLLPVIGEVAKQRPLLRSALEKGSPRERVEALETLYDLARGRDIGTLATQAATEAARANRAAGKKARSEAKVVSARRSGKSGSQPTGADLFRQQFRQATGLPEED